MSRKKKRMTFQIITSIGNVLAARSSAAGVVVRGRRLSKVAPHQKLKTNTYSNSQSKGEIL